MNRHCTEDSYEGFRITWKPFHEFSCFKPSSALSYVFSAGMFGRRLELVHGSSRPRMMGASIVGRLSSNTRHPASITQSGVRPSFSPSSRGSYARAACRGSTGSASRPPPFFLRPSPFVAAVSSSPPSSSPDSSSPSLALHAGTQPPMRASSASSSALRATEATTRTPCFPFFFGADRRVAIARSRAANASCRSRIRSRTRSSSASRTRVPFPSDVPSLPRSGTRRASESTSESASRPPRPSPPSVSTS